MKKQVSIKVYGLVQGVFFRSGVKEQADLLNLTGYVKNNWDGTLEILGCGEKEDLEKLIKWAKRGPSTAHVDKVETKWQKATSNCLGFEVRY